MNATPEEWRPVVGWEPYYEISSRGRVRAIPRVCIRRNGSPMPIAERLLKPYRTPPMGYLAVKLKADGRKVGYRIHVLVLEAFVGPRPEGFVACHADGDHDNNVPSNLRWDTQQGNIDDLRRHGTHRNTRKTECIRRHEFTPENTYNHPTSGVRQCRECRRMHMRQWKRRHKGQAA